jgi:channel protein (hemolysin III family)
VPDDACTRDTKTSRSCHLRFSLSGNRAVVRIAGKRSRMHQTKCARCAAVPAFASRRPYGPDELRADFLIHAIGVPGAILASAFLIFAAITHGGAGKVAAIIVYASGMVAMFTASAAYNLNYESRWRGVFRRCDHAAIFLMIAGTCTPFTTQIHSGQATIWFTAIIWLFSLLGVVLKIFVAERIERYSDWVYLGLGWAAVVVLTPLIANLEHSPADLNRFISATGFPIAAE